MNTRGVSAARGVGLGGIQVAAHGGQCAAPRRDDPLLLPLAAHAQQSARRVHVLVVEADQFADAQAGAVERLQDGPVAQADPVGGLRGLDERLASETVRKSGSRRSRRGERRADMGLVFWTPSRTRNL